MVVVAIQSSRCCLSWPGKSSSPPQSSLACPYPCSKHEKVRITSALTMRLHCTIRHGFTRKPGRKAKVLETNPLLPVPVTNPACLKWMLTVCKSKMNAATHLKQDRFASMGRDETSFGSKTIVIVWTDHLVPNSDRYNLLRRSLRSSSWCLSAREHCILRVWSGVIENAAIDLAAQSGEKHIVLLFILCLLTTVHMSMDIDKRFKLAFIFDKQGCHTPQSEHSSFFQMQRSNQESAVFWVLRKTPAIQAKVCNPFPRKVRLRKLSTCQSSTMAEFGLPKTFIQAGTYILWNYEVQRYKLSEFLLLIPMTTAFASSPLQLRPEGIERLPAGAFVVWNQGPPFRTFTELVLIHITYRWAGSQFTLGEGIALQSARESKAPGMDWGDLCKTITMLRRSAWLSREAALGDITAVCPFKLFRTMQHEGVRPDKVTFLLDVCNRSSLSPLGFLQRRCSKYLPGTGTKMLTLRPGGRDEPGRRQDRRLFDSCASLCEQGVRAHEARNSPLSGTLRGRMAASTGCRRRIYQRTEMASLEDAKLVPSSCETFKPFSTFKPFLLIYIVREARERSAMRVIHIVVFVAVLSFVPLIFTGMWMGTDSDDEAEESWHNFVFLPRAPNAKEKKFRDPQSLINRLYKPTALAPPSQDLQSAAGAASTAAVAASSITAAANSTVQRKFLGIAIHNEKIKKDQLNQGVLKNLVCFNMLLDASTSFQQDLHATATTEECTGVLLELEKLINSTLPPPFMHKLPSHDLAQLLQNTMQQVKSILCVETTKVLWTAAISPQPIKAVPGHGLARSLQNALAGLTPGTPILGRNVLTLPGNCLLTGCGSPVNLIQPLATVKSSQVLYENVADNCQFLALANLHSFSFKPEDSAKLKSFWNIGLSREFFKPVARPEIHLSHVIASLEIRKLLYQSAPVLRLKVLMCFPGELKARSMRRIIEVSNRMCFLQMECNPYDLGSSRVGRAGH
ncbi:hypothetical protein SELMODRAFT_408704 [Selaginella moellendorffii]|uniref:Uncharacterized protein n=1 Tax=Selaginella moellendorffii TaxID=88036 RepID=D8R9P4_SELML|nr:hypothetical protein SELMODRAFT_408704 [Selaginella moellendorffii]